MRVADAADQMPKRMAAERVAAEQNHVHEEHERADVDVEAIGPAHESVPRVFGEQDNENHRKVHEVAMNILNNQREGSFAPVGLARLADGAVGRVSPESFVIRAAIVITGEAETAGRPEDQEGGGKWQK